MPVITVVQLNENHRMVMMFKMGTFIFVLIAIIAIASAKPHSNRHRGYYGVNHYNPSDKELQKYAAKLLHYHFHHHFHNQDHDHDHDEEQDDNDSDYEDEDDDDENSNFFDHYHHQTFFEHPPQPSYSHGKHQHPHLEHYHQGHHPHHHHISKPVLEKIPEKPHKNNWTYNKHHEKVLQQGLSKPDITKKAPVGSVLKKATVQATSSPKSQPMKQTPKTTEAPITTTTNPTTTAKPPQNNTLNSNDKKPVDNNHKIKSKPFSETYYRIWFNKGE